MRELLKQTRLEAVRNLRLNMIYRSILWLLKRKKLPINTITMCSHYQLVRDLRKSKKVNHLDKRHVQSRKIKRLQNLLLKETTRTKKPIYLSWRVNIQADKTRRHFNQVYPLKEINLNHQLLWLGTCKRRGMSSLCSGIEVFILFIKSYFINDFQ